CSQMPVSSTSIANIERMIIQNHLRNSPMFPNATDEFYEAVQRASLHFKSQASTGTDFTDTQKVQYFLELLPPDLQSLGFSLLGCDERYSLDYKLLLTNFKSKLVSSSLQCSHMKNLLNISQGNKNF